MNRKSCFFIGHRDTSEDLYPALLAEVERHIIELGVTEFVVGHYGKFDRLAARAVIAAKEVHPNVSLILLLPYHPAEQLIKTPNGFDNSYYPPNMEKTPHRFAIIQGNRYMIDHVEYLIAYIRYLASNTGNFIAYAETREKMGKIKITKLRRICELESALNRT